MSDKAMVALFPDSGTAQRFALADGEAVDDLHITLAVLGQAADIGDPDALLSALTDVAATLPPIDLQISGAGRFKPPDGPDPVWLSVDAPELPGIRRAILEAVDRCGLSIPTDHGFTPHMTLAYIDPAAAMPEIAPEGSFRADAIWLCIGDDRLRLPLGAKPSAAATQRLTFAHPAEHRRRGLAAVKEHASLRKAAAATGIPKSTLHDWTRANTDDVLGDEPSVGELEQGEEIEGASSVGASDLSFDDLTPTGTGPDGTSADLPEDQLVNAPQPDQRPDDPLWLRAFHRYVTLIANDVHPIFALHTAQQIDPDFDLDDDEAAAVHAAVPGLSPEDAALGFAAGGGPPGYVKDIYQQISFTADDINTLGDHLYDTMLEAYTEGINQQLTALGRDTIDKVTDQGVLDGLRSAADEAAKGIGETWNRDVAAKTGQAWLDSASMTGARQGEAGRVGSIAQGALTQRQREDYVQGQVDGWMESRADWKPEQWAITQTNAAYMQGTQDFLGQNGEIAVSARVTPDSCYCSGCQDLVDIGDMPIADALALDLPLHPGCDHGLEVTYSDVPADTSVWAGQADEAA